MADPETKSPRVLIGMATGDYIHHMTALHFAAMLATSRTGTPGNDYADALDAHPSMYSGSIPPNNRSDLGHKALDCGADALLFIDCDMIMPPTTLLRLWSHGDLDVIGCTYAQRQPNGYVHGFETNGERISCEAGDDTIREVNDLPCGMLLIRRRVLEAIDLPIFKFPFSAGDRNSRSEDYDFCRRARALGFKVWLDPALSRALGHVGTAIYTIPALDDVKPRLAA